MLSQEAIIEKVKKLLVMSKKATTHEREVAYFKAQEMMAKYHLQEADVLTVEERMKVIHAHAYGINARRDVVSSLATTIARNFRCMVYWAWRGKQHCHMVFVGTEMDARVALAIFEDAYKFAEKEATRIADYQYNLVGTCEGVRGEWYTGFNSGLSKGFRDQIQTSESTAIMVIIPQEVKDDFHSQKFSDTVFNHIAASRNGSASLFNAGYQNGYDFSMNKRQKALSEDN